MFLTLFQHFLDQTTNQLIEKIINIIGICCSPNLFDYTSVINSFIKLLVKCVICWPDAKRHVCIVCVDGTISGIVSHINVELVPGTRLTSLWRSVH